MSDVRLDFFYDYVDPASYLVDHVLREEAPDLSVRLTPRPFEIRRPPAAMVDPRDPEWSRYHARMAEEARGLGVELERPRLVPWSRKAHELAFVAREAERFPAVHRALFRAHFVEGRDLGRVDVLVEIADESGLDRTAAKTALDVDRHLEAVEEERSRAERLDVRGVPTLLGGERRLEAFHPRDEIHTFLAGVADDA